MKVDIAAAILDVSPRTMRKYCQEGLVKWRLLKPVERKREHASANTLWINGDTVRALKLKLKSTTVAQLLARKRARQGK